MKTLFIVRHGKSDWEYDDVSDIDRSLKERGINDGYEMAERIRKKGLTPDLIITSTATRASHTALIFSRVLDMEEETVVFSRDLYLAGTDDILSVIFGVDDSIDKLMIFGHNPGFTYLANQLSNMQIMNVPTTGMVILNFNVEKWTEISRDKIVSEEFDYPKNI
jgi:phosphohistidine phosphatase